MPVKLIGTSQTPKDLAAKVTGRARFAEDFRADGMLFAKLLLSPVPNGRVRRLDVSGALAIPGVVAVVTADDLPTLEPGGPTPSDSAYLQLGEPPLTHAPIYQGQPIAALAAVDETTAAEGIAALQLEIERLPFVLDPLESLRPDGPMARPQGNVLVDGEITAFHWSEDEYRRVAEGERFPENVRVTDEWSYGDLQAALAASALVLEEPLVYHSLTHHPLEPRSALAYWQNGKVYLHCSTQSTARTRPVVAGRLGLEPEDVVIVGEYCGGGFGSKGAGTVTDVIPALLARKTGRPVMMRVTREEETYFGRARPGLQGWAKLGFRDDGRLLALDMLVVGDNGPYGRAGDFNSCGLYASLAFQPTAQRHRGIPVHTNTPPRGPMRGPGATQGFTLLNPIMAKAARRLGVDPLDMMLLNAPPQGAVFGPDRTPVTSSFAREAIALGRELFRWEEKKALSGRVSGSKVTGVGTAICCYSAGTSGYDGLLVIRPDGKLTIHSGVGNLGTHSTFDTCMPAAEALGAAWDDVEIVWGDTSKGLPWSSMQVGSQTTHAHTRANHAAGQDARRKLQEIAALDLGGRPEDYQVDGGRVFRHDAPATGMTFAQAARRAIQLGGRYDGHELPEDLNAMTAESVRDHLMGQGLVAAATDRYSHNGQTRTTCISFCLVEVDRETGVVEMKELVSTADCGTVLNPRGLAAQVFGGTLQGLSSARFEKWSYDPRWGVNSNKRFHTAKPASMLDAPERVDFRAVDLPDPENPVGSKGIGEPPIGAGSAAVICAISDALGGVYFGRTPISVDAILNAISGVEPGYSRLQTHV
jgi:xanthine dehydrogenase molybdenum-binding subunit